MDDAEAIARLKRGSISGLEALVCRYQEEALQAAYLICRDYPLAEDIVQSAFIRVYERIDQFDATRPFAPWFLRSVVNDALMAVTRQHHGSLDAALADNPDLLASSDPDLESLVEAAETRQELWALIERLAPGQRTALVMRYYLEYSDMEIAEALACPAGTVRRRLHDARRRLRRLLPAWLRRSS